MNLGKITTLLVLVSLLGPLGIPPLGAQTVHGPNITGEARYIPNRAQVLPPREDGLWPGLRLKDAKLALAYMVRNLFIMRVLEDGSRETVRVRTVSYRLVEEARLPPPQEDGKRMGMYDLVVNGVVIDPRDFAILYNERILNLGALFTYRQEFYPSLQGVPWEYGE